VAINYIGSASSENSSTIDLTGISMQPDDIVVVISGKDISGTPNLATGFTNIYDVSVSFRLINYSTRVMYKIMPNPVDTSVTGLTQQSDCGHLAMVFRGVDTSSPINTSSGTTSGISSGSPNSPPIASTVDRAMIVSMGFLDDDLISTPTPPSGFTLGSFNTFGSSGNGGSVMGAYLTQTTPGLINPGVWVTNLTDSWTAVSIALTPLENSYIGNYTSTYTKDYNLSYIATALTGKFRMWNGTSWQVAPVRMWNGSSWQLKKVKRWNGTAWIDVNIADLELTYVPDMPYNMNYVRDYNSTIFYGGNPVTTGYSNTYAGQYVGNMPTYDRFYVSNYSGEVFYGGVPGTVFYSNTNIINYGPVYTGLATYNLSYDYDYTGLTYDSLAYSGEYTAI